MKKFIQLVEVLCAVFILLGGLNVFIPLNFWVIDTEFFTQLAYGAIVAYAVILCMKKRKQTMTMPAAIIVMAALLLGCLTVAHAQNANYQKQIDAFQKSFAEKSIDPVKSYISPELKFYTYPAGATPQILGQVFSNLPSLNSIAIIESKVGEAQIHYNFSGLGERNSSIRFNEEGKITKIELIDHLLVEQAKAQAALAEQVQAPDPGELGRKYRPQKIEFPSSDGLMITGHLYEVDPAKPVILLCHSGGGNKFEYADIAPRLNARGFNALAIDQRSGAAFAGQPNETFAKAKEQGLATEFVDAQTDIEAAIDYLAGKYGRKVTLWGSSYSAALSLFIVQDNEHLNGMILFSPGDYLSGRKGSLKGRLNRIDIPFLITSTQEEAEDITNTLLHNVTLSDTQKQHVPSFAGYHGSRALWVGQKGAEEYWEQVWATLELIYPKKY